MKSSIQSIKRKLAVATTALIVLTSVMKVSDSLQEYMELATGEDMSEYCEPHYIHLSLGKTSNQVVIMWTTKSKCDTNVKFGLSPWNITQTLSGISMEIDRSAYGRRTNSTKNVFGYLHLVILSDLLQGLTYYYRPISNFVGKNIYYFKTPKTEKNATVHLLVFAIFGSTEMLSLIEDIALTGKYDASIQLQRNLQFISNKTTREYIDTEAGFDMAAYLPLMAVPLSIVAEFSNKDQSPDITIPNSDWPIKSNEPWYSFNLGLAHFISFSTDVYLERRYAELQQRQNEWLVNDLSAANSERQLRPWIIAFGSHPLYCPHSHLQYVGDQEPSLCRQNSALIRAGVENLFFNYGVDLVLTFHNDSYARTFPSFSGMAMSRNYSNYNAPVHLVLGSASTNSWLSSTNTTRNTFNANDTDRDNTGDRVTQSTVDNVGVNSNSHSVLMTKNRSDDDNEATQVEVEDFDKFPFALIMVNGSKVTYGRLTIINASVIEWQLLSGSDWNDHQERETVMTVIDSVSLLQQHHHKFRLNDLPQNVKQDIHSTLIENEKFGKVEKHNPEGEKEMAKIDKIRRAIIGCSFGAVVLLVIIGTAVVGYRRRGNRRVIRRWDTIDYKYGKSHICVPSNDDFDDLKNDDFEMEINDESRLQTTKLINGK